MVEAYFLYMRPLKETILDTNPDADIEMPEIKSKVAKLLVKYMPDLKKIDYHGSKIGEYPAGEGPKVIENVKNILQSWVKKISYATARKRQYFVRIENYGLGWIKENTIITFFKQLDQNHYYTIDIHDDSGIYYNLRYKPTMRSAQSECTFFECPPDAFEILVWLVS